MCVCVVNATLYNTESSVQWNIHRQGVQYNKNTTIKKSTAFQYGYFGVGFCLILFHNLISFFVFFSFYFVFVSVLLSNFISFHNFFLSFFQLLFYVQMNLLCFLRCVGVCVWNYFKKLALFYRKKNNKNAVINLPAWLGQEFRLDLWP